MALTVEDGTGKPDADAFVSLADFKAYCDKRGTSYTTDELIEQAIVRATDYVSGIAWPGYPVYSRVDGSPQALAWPRAGVTDAEGYSVASDVVPDEVVEATILIAVYELGTPGGMSPTHTPGKAVKRVKVGDIEREFAATDTTASAQIPVLTKVSGLIAGLLGSAGGSSLQGESGRG